MSIPIDIEMSVGGGPPMTVASDWRPGDPVWRGTVGGRKISAQIRPLPNGVRIAWRGMSVDGARHAAADRRARTADAGQGGAGHVEAAALPDAGAGRVDRGREGQEVKAGETLAVVEAMKMENVLRAERDLTVAKINAKPGDSLAVDAVIMEFA